MEVENESKEGLATQGLGILKMQRRRSNKCRSVEVAAEPLRLQKMKKKKPGLLKNFLILAVGALKLPPA